MKYFIKYFAIVFLLLHTACIPAPTPIPTSTNTPTSINTLKPEPTPTETPIPLVDLTGSLFFDYNGSGLWEEGEPPNGGFGVCAQPAGSDKVCTETDAEGYFLFMQLAPLETHVDLTFNDPNGDDPTLAFRYINHWHGPMTIPAYEMNGVQVPEQHLNDTEVLGIDSLVRYEVGDEIELGLMQGFVTLPFSKETDFTIDRMYDHAQGKLVLWWDGEHPYDPGDNIFYAVPPGTNEHPGIDYRMDIGEKVLAAAPGQVRFSGGRCNGLIITHNSIEGRPIYTEYAHLSEVLVEVGQSVSRGEIIRLNGKTCTPYPHIHYSLMAAPNDTDYWGLLDFYAPIVEVPEGFWLGNLPLPIWTEESHPADGLSFWTKYNDPQFSK
jgi:hypothetical protein